MRSSSRLSVAVWTPLCALIALALPGVASALKAPPPQLRELEEADRKALETIAGHPEPLRDAVLKASLHVDALVETQRIQEQSSASFQDRIGKLDKKQQEQIWNVVREPGLLDELATEERPSRSELDEIAKRHPEELAPAIRTVGAKHHDLLVDIALIHGRANERFDAAIADLDDETQQAFRALVDQPELLSVLVRRVNLVVRLGDSYRKNPRDTRSYLAALAVDVEKRNAAAEREWKERIENDPKAAAELDQAARDYAEENGYDYDELTDPAVRTRVTVVVNPYPFWFGYPVWYSDVYLYPYGWWYPYPPYFGYYHYRNHFVWWGLPSFTFMHWFYWGHHHHHYAYLSNSFTHHYRTYPYASTYYNVTVNNFISRSDPIDHHRGDWSWGRGGRSSGGRGGSEAAAASYSGRGRGVFFNRERAQDRFQQLDRRVAPGERGIAIDEPRGRSGRSADFGRGGRGQIQPQREAGAAPSEARSLGGRGQDTGRSRGRGRDQLQAREAPSSVIESPQSDRGHARGTGHERVERPSSRGDRSQFFQRSNPEPQREGPAAPPRGRGPREGRRDRGNVEMQRGVEVHRGGDPAPHVDAPDPPSGDGGRGQGSHREAAPSPRGDGGSRDHRGAVSGGGDRGRSRGHIAGGSGDGGGSSRGHSGGSWSGGGGGSRGQGGGWGGGGSNRGGGGGHGGGRSDFGGGGGRGDFGGGGGRGGR